MSLTLGIDLDGVVCDFANKANRWLADELEVPPIPIDRWDWYRGYGAEVLPLWNRLWDVEVPNGFFRVVEPVYLAHLGLSILREQGHKLVFCTARPMVAAADTEAWLEDLGFGGHHLFVTADSKAKVHMGVDLLIDDKADTINRHRAAGKNAVLFKQAWNRDHWHRVPSVTGWQEVIDLVGALDG